MSYYDRWAVKKALQSIAAPDFSRVMKDNPYHDELGRFATADSSTGGKAYADKRGFVRSGGLNARGRRAESSFYNRIASHQQDLIDRYHAQFGNTIDPDSVKKLSPAFVKDLSLAPAVHEPSSYLSKQIFSQALEKKAASGDTSPTIFTAGGSGSGKSESMHVAMGVTGDNHDGLVFDSTLSNFKSSTAKIDEALDKTKGDVNIVYTNAPIDKAFAFNANRARAVTTETLAGAHVGASDNIRALSDHYSGNNRVKITVVNNPSTIDKMSIGSISDVPKYDKATLLPRLNGLATSMQQQGAISEERRKYLSGGSH